MTRNISEVEQAVSRTLRDSLERLEHSTEELNQAISDLVAACGSTRPVNSLPPMLRAQTAAASLAASLEVLSRFVTAALQPELRSALEKAALAAVEPLAAWQSEAPISDRAMASQAPERLKELGASDMVEEGAPVGLPVGPPAWPPTAISEQISQQEMASQPPETAEELRSSDMVEEGAPVGLPAWPPTAISEQISQQEMASQPPETAEELRSSDMVEEGAPLSKPEYALPDFVGTGQDAPPLKPASIAKEALPGGAGKFDISGLAPEEQELHRRANRVAKVSMQDIKMLRPREVILGKERKDLCNRLREDIERAHKEYERRFQAILGHRVDYFYDWMVEILAEGDASALGEYPYPSPVLRH